MKSKFKNLILVSVLALAAALPICAPAQLTPTIPITLTNVVPLVGTNTTTNFCDVFVPQDDFQVEWVGNLTASANSNAWLKGFLSVGGTNFDTTPVFSVAVTGNGTTDFYGRTNVTRASVRGATKMRLRFDNANSQNITNKQVNIRRASN